MISRSTRRNCLVLCCTAAVLSGCSCWDVLDVRSQSPDDEPAQRKLRLIREMAVPYGMFPIKVEGVGLVTGLPGTGSDPSPSPYRAALLADMQTRGVDNPNAVLASSTTALVLVRGVLRPGIGKGDRFDVEIRIPSRSDTTSLRGGHLLETRLRELALLNHQIRRGHLLGLAKGPVMVDPKSDGQRGRVLAGRGRILGGGMGVQSRQLGLVLKPDSQSVFNSARIANALNKRFHTFRKGVKVGVANACTDKFIELDVHPRYHDNIPRYVQVVRAVAMRESASQRRERTEELGRRLLDPATAAGAAMELEAMGTLGVDALLEGIKADDAEIRFYSAEALAYLDRREAAEPLGKAARNQPAFRVFALTALSVMDDFVAHEQLRELLDVSSAETRYGAFRALCAMNADDPLVMGENLGGQFSYHVLGTTGPEMIHVTRNRRPEIVIFGQRQRLKTPLAVNAGPQIMITSTGGEQVSISKFSVNEPDQKRVVSTRLDEVIRTVVELDGTYPDVVQALQEAEAADVLPGRFEVDTLPEAGRSYRRIATGQAARADQPGSGQSENETRADSGESASPKQGGRVANSKKNSPNYPDSGSKPNPLRGFLARITGRGSE